jgi:spoIIIJ-associated protein
VSEATIGVMDQARMAEEFLLGLAERMGLEGAATSVQELDEELAEVRLDGEGTGLLVGRRGATLQALQELTKTVLQRRTPPDAEGRIRVDVAGYRERRRAALEAFVRSIADEVKATGEEQALEPMNAADRKVVHDTVNEIEGVATTSEGADPRRRVVIVPA